MASPLLSRPANAQNTTASPLLTGEVRPASSIANSQRSASDFPRSRNLRALLTSLPDTSEKGAGIKVPSLAPAVEAAPATQTIVQPALTPVVGAANVLKTRVTSSLAMRAAAARQPKTLTNTPTPVENVRLAANLPARGGLVQNSGPIVLTEPKEAPAAGNVDESQRILLARLDA
ncbi:hypothetical protein EON80_26180, partial [bacterium]